MADHSAIRRLRDFTAWVKTLNDLDPGLWLKPIAAGKWSTAEIVAHLANWDRHILSSILPAARQGGAIRFPDEDAYNRQASDYAKSGITQSALLAETIRTRERLVAELLEMPEEWYARKLNYSLDMLIPEFANHDDHHRDQIVRFLRANAK
ncbi:DinB family protein [Paenibacillus glycinis]|uniref:DinB family protein n=1 Tax=Paenibacillus glycinis TaxID=2697035 RepID=A0ABW9XX82_9BACL|nr:DinB family protein [Paenibacillus glycinis]NBD27126.1 DinB family protein [Paenibacillus glycinis]